MADANSVADWSDVADDNLNIGGINLGENVMKPAGVNNAFREMMAQLKTKFTTSDQQTPTGLVAPFARNSAPTGWLKANGAAVSRTTYAALFAAIGTTFGAGNGSSTFNVPDLRGEFIRGWDDGRGVDTSRAFGSAQSGQNASHYHAASATSEGAHTHTASTNSTGAHTHTGSTSSDSHNHTGTTASAGNHTHDVRIRDAAGSSNNGGGYSLTGGDWSYETYGDAALSAGAHTHTFTTSSDSHSHTFTTASAGAHSHTVTVNSAGAHTHTISISLDGGIEARPRNVALLYCIKY